MNHQLTIFTEKTTPRIDYIFDFIFCNFSGINYKITTNSIEFQDEIGPKINCSKLEIHQSIHYPIDEFFYEEEIKLTTNYNKLNDLGKCFYWLSRYEEYIAKSHQFDEHQRFLGSDLDYSQPIVDLICLEIQNEIQRNYPTIEFKKRKFKQINTHDVDYAWKYLHHSPKIKYGSLFKKLIKGDLKNLKIQLDVLSGKEKDPYDTYSYLKDLAQKHQIETIFFWLLGDYSTFDKNHHFENNQQKELINKILNWAQIGIHPSYQSNLKTERLNLEINRLKNNTKQAVEKSRQHFIKLSFPQTYQQLLTNQIKEDYTMGFAHKIGFRAGTSIPYKWFDLSTNQQTLLTIYPFVAMDVTLKNYLKLTPKEAIHELNQLKQTIKKVEGTFITIFHQSNLSEDWSDWREVYESIFE